MVLRPCRVEVVREMQGERLMFSILFSWRMLLWNILERNHMHTDWNQSRLDWNCVPIFLAPNFVIPSIIQTSSSTYKRMMASTTPIASTATSKKGKTAETMIRVKATIIENCRNMWICRGSTVSTSSWSLEKRLRIRPDGVVSKKLMGLAIICGINMTASS